jgi:hypothetical protein
MKLFVDHLEILYIYVEMGNNKYTEMQLTFSDSTNTSMFKTTPKVDGTGLYLPAVNHMVLTKKFGILNVQFPDFAPGVQQGYIRGPHTCLFIINPQHYDIRICNSYQRFRLVEM